MSRKQSNFCHLGKFTHLVYEGSDYYIQFYLFSAYQIKVFQFLGKIKIIFCGVSGPVRSILMSHGTRGSKGWSFCSNAISLQIFSSLHTIPQQVLGHMQMSMRNGVTPKLKLTLTLTLTDTEGAVLTLMLGYRSLYITWQQHHNCRIVRELSLHILICIHTVHSAFYF